MDEFAQYVIDRAPVWLVAVAALTLGAQLFQLGLALLSNLRSGVAMGPFQVLGMLPDMVFRPAILLALAAIASGLRRR